MRKASIDKNFRRSCRGVAGFLTSCALALAALGGCGSTQERAITLDLAPSTGPLAVDIENFRGSVDLRAEPGAERVEIYGFVKADERFDSAKLDEVFGAVNVTAEVIEDGPRGTLRVRSSSLREEDDHRVDLVIRTPRCDGLRVVNEGGLVLAVNCAGATEVMNRRGSVEIRTSRPMVDPVTITTTDGNIYYQVPPGSTGQFDLLTLDGTTTFVDRTGNTSQSVPGARDAYAGALNDGTNPVVARTNNGDVRVWVIDNPVALVRMFRWKLYDPRDDWFEHGPRRHTRNLPTDHPEVTGPLTRTGPAFEMTP